MSLIISWISHIKKCSKLTWRKKEKRLPIPDRISFLHWYHQQFRRSITKCRPPVDIFVECTVKCNETVDDNSCIVDCPIFGRKCMQQPYQLRLQKTTWFFLSVAFASSMEFRFFCVHVRCCCCRRRRWRYHDI